MSLQIKYPVSPGTMARNASTAEHPFALDGLVGAWGAGIDPSAHDLSGHGGIGTVNGGVTLAGTDAGRAWDFDGIDGYISIASSAVPTGQDPPTTRCFWVYQRTRTNGVNSAVLDQIKGANEGFVIQCATVSSSDFLFTDSVNSANNISTTLPTLNTWVHVTFTMDVGKKWNYYLDGALVANGTFSQTIQLDSNAISIGRRTSGVIAYYDGLIDDVRVYDVEQSSDWVMRNYLLGLTGRYAWARRKPIQIPYEPAAAPAGGAPPMLTLLGVG